VLNLKLIHWANIKKYIFLKTYHCNIFIFFYQINKYSFSIANETSILKKVILIYYCKFINLPLIKYLKLDSRRFRDRRFARRSKFRLSIKIARKRNVELFFRGKSALRLLRARVELRAHVARTRHYRVPGTSIDVFPGRGPGEGESKGINVDFWQERIGINGKFARLNGLQMFSGPGGTIARVPKVVSEAISRFAFRRIKNSAPLLRLFYPIMGALFILPFLPRFLSPCSLRPPHLPVFALVKNDSPSTSRHIRNIFVEYE